MNSAAGSNEVVLFVLVAVAVVSIVGALFGMYVVGRIVRRFMFGVVGATDAIGRFIVGGPPRPAGLASAPKRMSGPMPPGGIRRAGRGTATLRCPRPRCHAENVPSAKFCRRCGAAMDERAAVARGYDTGRAAMW